MNKTLARTVKWGTLALLGVPTLLALVALAYFVLLNCWEAATTFATLVAGLIAADVVVWQVRLLKKQLAFSTYLELDMEWNSAEMIEARKSVCPPGLGWNLSRLEGVLEFFEKLSSLFKVSGDINFICESTLGWYAAQYFLFAREHGNIQHLREQWREPNLYQDLEAFYDFYLEAEAGSSQKAKNHWEAERLRTEDTFWMQERED